MNDVLLCGFEQLFIDHDHILLSGELLLLPGKAKRSVRLIIWQRYFQ
jgi:hypothetical protein